MLHQLNILWSYAYVKSAADLKMIHSLCDVSNILLDSGAFTAFMTGKEIKLETYTEFCRDQLHGRVWQYIALDKVKDPKTTSSNLDYMIKQGLKPMPVFQMNEDLSKVKDLVSLNEHICVAGGVGSADDYIRHRYQSAFKASEGKAKIHALGYLRFPDVFRLPLFSGDSCSYAAGQMWGSFQKFEPRTGVKSFTLVQVKQSKEWIEFMNKCGIARSDVDKKFFNKGTCSFLATATLFAHVQFSKFCLAKGFRYFFAIPNKNWINMLAAVISTSEKNNFNYHTTAKVYESLRTIQGDEWYSAAIPMLRKYATI